MIRVALLDREPAVRAGVEAILRSEPDLEHVGGAAHRNELWPLLHGVDPDVVVVGAVAGAEAATTSLRIRSRRAHTRIVIYVGDAGAHAVVSARFAGAHAVVEKTAHASVLLAAIRAAHAETAMPPITPFMQRRAAALLGPRDRAILAMRLAGTAAPAIAATLGMPLSELEGNSLAIIDRLGHPGTPPRDGVGAHDWPYRIHALPHAVETG